MKIITRKDAGFPPILHQYVFMSTIDRILLRGNPNILLKRVDTLIAILCSDKSPPSILLQLQDLSNSWRRDGPIVISGFHSQGEQEVLSVLFRGISLVIICQARGIGKMRIKPEWKKPLAEGRLLLLSPFEDNVKRPTVKTAYLRNQMVAAIADVVLVAHAQPGSKTEKLVSEILEWDKPIFTLPNKANKNLEDLGIKFIEEI